MALTRAKTTEGIVRGVPKDGYTVFKGVPYAKPPVGPLRFEAPEDPDPYPGGYYDAAQWPAMAVQCRTDPPEGEPDPMGLYAREFHDDQRFSVPASEDCLYLNIWTPARDAGEKLPVAVWIHGGALNHGYCSEKEFDGEAYAARGVILVSIAYRVNVFGFMYTEEQESRVGHSGNQGHLDQVKALTWVKKNIAAFGGDSENITLFGQSAGAMSSQVLAASPLTDGLFDRVILQSGGGLIGLASVQTRGEALELGREVMERCGVSSVDELKALPSATLYRAACEMERAHQGLVFRTVIDDYLLDDDLPTMAEKGDLAKVPYMIGYTKDDIASVPGQSPRESLLYKAAEDYALRLERMEYPPVYVYEFLHDLPGSEDGAFHSAELWYTFGTLGRCWRPMGEADYALSKEMVKLWTDFMKTGVPSEDWRGFTEDDPYVRSFR